MSFELAVELREGPIERVRTDLVIVGFAPGDRPLRHGAGRVDWRLCGSLSDLILSEKLSGTLGEAALLSARGALRSPLLLAVGLGPREGLAVESWRELGRETIARALGLRAESAVLDLAADAAEAGSEATRALFCGAAIAVAEHRVGLRLVLTGDGAAARLAELRAMPEQQLPPGIGLRLPDPTTRAARSSPRWAGGFRHTGIH